jgi:hypothetical protein
MSIIINYKYSFVNNYKHYTEKIIKRGCAYFLCATYFNILHSILKAEKRQNLAEEMKNRNSQQQNHILPVTQKVLDRI